MEYIVNPATSTTTNLQTLAVMERELEPKMAINRNFIPATDAATSKRADGRRDSRMSDYDELMLDVTKHPGEALQLMPEGKDTARAYRLRVALSINRLVKAGKIHGGDLSTWTGQDGSVYVQFKPVAGETPDAATNETPEVAPPAVAPTRPTVRR